MSWVPNNPILPSRVNEHRVLTPRVFGGRSKTEIRRVSAKCSPYMPRAHAAGRRLRKAAEANICEFDEKSRDDRTYGWAEAPVGGLSERPHKIRGVLLYLVPRYVLRYRERF